MQQPFVIQNMPGKENFLELYVNDKIEVSTVHAIVFLHL